MPGQPLLHVCALGGAVVQNQVHRKVFGRLPVDHAMIAMDRLNYAIPRPSERVDTRHGHGSTWLLTKSQQTPVAGKAGCGA